MLRNGVQYDFDYDRQNHLTKVTRENRVLCRISYDDGGRISRILEEDGSATAYRYTPSGVLKEYGIAATWFTILRCRTKPEE